MERIVNRELKNPLFIPPKYQQFLIWHKGMVHYYLLNDFQKAKDLLIHALDTYKSSLKYTEIQIEILITFANIHAEIKEYENAIDTYNTCLEQLKKLPRINDKTIEVRILYNLALTFSKMDKDDLAIGPCKNGINKCKKEKTLYLFGEFYYQYGYSLWKTYQINEALEQLQNATQIFKLLDKENYIQHTNNIIEEIIIDKKKKP